MKLFRMYELQISYFTKRLAEIPHGSFGVHRGEAVVYVTYDPCDKTVDAHHKKTYRIDSAQGRQLSPFITEYTKIRGQLDTLKSQWNSTFKFAPRLLDYPLQKKRKTFMTDEFYRNAKEYANPVTIENPIEYNGRILRSKNEHICCQVLDKLGLEYKIEIAVGDEYCNIMYPDITFLVPSQQRCIGIEVNGALGEIKYAQKSMNRHKSYMGYGLKIGKDIIFVDISESTQFYADVFEDQVKTAILIGLNDIVFPYGVDDILRDSGSGEFWF